jgi:hypothetical protein
MAFARVAATNNSYAILAISAVRLPAVAKLLKLVQHRQSTVVAATTP